MFKKLTTLAIFSFSLTVSAASPSTYYQVKTELIKTSNKQLTDWVKEIVKVSVPSRMVGSKGHAQVRDYLKTTVEKLDPKKSGKLIVTNSVADIKEARNFYQRDFDQKVEGKIPKTHPDYKKWAGFTTHMQQQAERLQGVDVSNIVWEKTGLNQNKVLVVTAHYDTISLDDKTFTIKEKEAMPGANYNASGVAVALGMIKTLAAFDLNYSVQVVFLDWQGIGFLGSYQYARDLKDLQAKGKDILGVINLEMLGQDTSFFDKSKKLGNMSAYVRDVTAEKTWTKKLLEHGSKISQKVTFELKPNSFDRTDSFRFWEKDFKSVSFSQNWEEDFNPKFFQSPQDTPETLNHETLYHAYQYIGGAVISMLLDITK
ncbi:MAG TPA: M28 family peptidase [Bacteriovoracaceae bacterium]|nr:M28 family peptidase [Bacteriovoracaceae bacterium]